MNPARDKHPVSTSTESSRFESSSAALGTSSMWSRGLFWSPNTTWAMTSTDDAPESNPKGSCPVQHPKIPAAAKRGGGCPMRRKPQMSDDTIAAPKDKRSFPLPASLEESSRHAQTPRPDQAIPLSTERVVSSIPRADDKTNDVPHHQPTSKSKWVYPSEQQFYNAMRRKGWDGIDESTIPLVVRIHNHVNEKGWREVQRWESTLHGCYDPRLVRFLGRPNDTSPKAWINRNLLFREAPFDRHDWFIDRGDGSEPRRYVIDFYEGGSNSSQGVGLLGKLRRKLMGDNAPAYTDDRVAPPKLPSMYIDVRPALDSTDSVLDRLHMCMRESLPGIFWALDKRQALMEERNPSVGDSERAPPASTQG